MRNEAKSRLSPDKGCTMHNLDDRTRKGEGTRGRITP